MTLPAEHLILKNVDLDAYSNAPKLSEALKTYLRLKSEGRDQVFERGTTRNIKRVIKYTRDIIKKSKENDFIGQIIDIH